MTEKPSVVILAMLLAGAAAGCRKPAPPQPRALGTLAVLKTSKGAIKIRLFTDKAPKTAANFIALATGAKPWRDPRTGKTSTAPLYNGVLFHRVIPGFMIQTGDPLGDGRGDIGYAFEDEFHPDLRYDRAGLLGMANYGPNTNASQFFITLAPTPHLDGLHTVFGEVVEGLEVARAIALVPRDESEGSDRPLKPVVLEAVDISDQE